MPRSRPPRGRAAPTICSCRWSAVRRRRKRRRRPRRWPRPRVRCWRSAAPAPARSPPGRWARRRRDVTGPSWPGWAPAPATTFPPHCKAEPMANVTIPYVRDIKFEYGRVDQVSPLIRRVIANNPGPFTFTGTGTYIIGRGAVAVIDPGPDQPEHLKAILGAVAGEKVTHILITHHHLDHSPLARPLAEKTGAVIYGCAVK